MKDRKDSTLLGHIRPVHMMTVVALYLAGAGLARYQGAVIDLFAFGLGLAWLICLFQGMFFLGDHFQTPFEKAIFPLEIAENIPEENKKDHFPNRLLYGALSLLTAAAVFTILLGLGGVITPSVAVIMAGCFAILIPLVVPGINLDQSGIGEFFLSISLVVFPSALSFFTQFGSYHPALSLGIFPLFPFHLGLILTLRLRSYPQDLRAGRKTLLVRMGWIRGVFLHNLLLLSAFVLLGAAILFGLPLRIAGPVFLVLPLAGYLIYTYSRLEIGAPVHWPLIIFLSLAVFFLPVYLIVFTVWIF